MNHSRSDFGVLQSSNGAEKPVPIPAVLDLKSYSAAVSEMLRNLFPQITHAENHIGNAVLGQ